MEPAYRVLDQKALHQIHQSTLEALYNTGVTVMHADALEMLGQAGAHVDLQSQIAKIPADLVESCLKTAPRSFTMAGRNPANDCQIGSNTLFCRNGGGPGHVLDMHTGNVRDAMLIDVGDYARLVDALAGIHIAAPMYAQDVPPNVRDLTVLATMFANTSKHINMRLLQLSSLPYVLRMAEVVAGSKENLRTRPILTLLESPIAPLRLPDVLVETLFACGALGISVELCSMPIAGATGPITLAGSLLMSNIEMVASIVISQLANPGAPLVFTPRIMIMDMRNGRALTGSIENALLAAAGVQLARQQYNLPVNMHGPYTDSQTSDAQAGIENTYFTLLPALSGADILTGAGHMEGGLFVSFPQLMIDSEIIGIVQRALQGFEVDQNSLALPAIHRSLSTNNLLTDAHTLANLRKTNPYKPALISRTPRQMWQEAGSPTMQDRSVEMAKQTLASHTPLPLDPAIQRELDQLLVNAAKELSM